MFLAIGIGLLVVPFLLGRSQFVDWEAPDPTRKVSLADDDPDDAAVDRIFTDDVAAFDEDMELEESLAELVERESQERFAWGSEALAASGLFDIDRLDNGRFEFELQCAGCHGLLGNGSGPAARYLDPRPRNFRKGMYKFTSVADGGRPRREDLLRTITEGLAGSSMPGFPLLPEGRRRSIVEYVRWLAVKGEFEQAMLNWAWSDEELPDPDEVYEIVAERWSEKETAEAFPTVAEPENDEASIERGRELFVSESGASCLSCHGAGGLGDGPASGAMVDQWGYPIVPRDLTTGIYRSGGSGRGLWQAIAHGIGGSGMPGYLDALGGEDIWHIVHFIQSLATDTQGGR